MLACLALLTMTQWPEKEWAFKLLEAGPTSAIKEQAVFVLRTQDEFNAYMEKRGGTRRPLPKIDWRINQIVAIHVGQRPTAGYGVDLAHLWKEPFGASAEVKETKPGPDMMAAQVITYPFVMVRTERFSGRVERKPEV